MSQILFVNACMRKNGKSRTEKLARAFVDAYQKYNPQDTVAEIELTEESLHYLKEEDTRLREQLVSQGQLNHPMLRFAVEFAAADKIIVAAPFWDLSFPALLKIYIETVCVCDITFRYTDSGQEGMCRAEKLLYLVTRGGEFSTGFEAQYEMGEPYLKSMCAMFGIPEYASVVAEGLDIVENDAEEILRQAIDKAEALAQVW